MAKPRKLTEEMVQRIREMYSTREFTMNDLSKEFGVSVSVISNAINKGYCPKPTGYDFYSEHWIPLYKARGLKWHDIEKED